MQICVSHFIATTRRQWCYMRVSGSLLLYRELTRAAFIGTGIGSLFFHEMDPSPAYFNATKIRNGSIMQDRNQMKFRCISE